MWIACRPRFFLTVKVLSALFRGLFLEMLVAAHEAGRLQFFGEHAAARRQDCVRGLSGAAAQDDWVVYAKEPFGGPQAKCCAISRATPTASPSPIAGCCPPTRTASPSSRRTIGSRGPPATRR